MVIKRDISSNEIADRAEGVLSALLNRKLKKTEFETEIPSSSSSETNLQNWKIFNGIIYFVIGIISITIGILTTVYPITKIIMDDRLKMTSGLPSFELWYKPKPEVILRTYIFNVTNSYEFANGIDKKMKIVEVGPIVYREILQHSNVEYHEENSTMSYTVTRSVVFLPERNEPGILNKTIIVPNIPLLGMASYLQDYMFTVKMGFSFMSRTDKIFLNVTIGDYLWNLTTPALTAADKYVSFMTPVSNTGPLSIVYKDFNDRVNVNIGEYHGYQDFFKINTYNNAPTVPGFKPNSDCYASLMNSTEGAIYGQSISKDDILYYWRKTVCRPIPLYFEEEITIRKILGYKYVTKSNMYDRTNNPSTDCYKSFKKMQYPSGMSDASKCFMDLPIAMSLPHFYDRTGYWDDKIEGYKPSKDKHTSYAIIEPLTGIPLDQRARSQSNLVVPKLTGFNTNISRFSNMVIPMVWLEYHLEKLTPTIDLMLYTLATILPIGQYVLSVGILLLGIYVVIIAVRRLELGNRLKLTNTNLIYTFDNEVST